MTGFFVRIMEDAPQIFLDIALPPVRFLSCQRCGITFAWTGWEQQMDGQEPAYCPGCRHLLALTRRWGVVKWFDARKGFGFITMTDGTDVFVRRRDIRGRKNLRKGQLVQFRLKEGRNGARATSVRIQNRPAPE